MVRLYTAPWFTSVCMERIQMSTDILNWPEILLEISIQEQRAKDWCISLV